MPNRPTVLLAEDQVAWRELMTRALLAAGYHVIAVPDGEGLMHLLQRMLSQAEELPDAIVSDLRMPGTSGLLALARLRQDDDFTPFFLMTAFAGQDTHLDAHRLGVTAVFDKPFEPQALVDRLLKVVPVDA
jgi:CheY-like chemotaxis protein